MQKNKKAVISISAILKKMARRSFMVFLALFFISAGAALVIISNYQPEANPGEQKVSGGGLFGPSRIKEYQEVFSIIEQRQLESDAAASTTYPHIFKQLTE